MKNIINFDIDISKIPINERKYLYLHNDIYQDIEVNEETDKQVLVEVKNEEIKIEAFIYDQIENTWNKEIDYLVNLESVELKNYYNENKFSILLREQVKKKLLEINNYFKDNWYYLAIKIWYRPYQVQKNLFSKVYNYLLEKNPEKSKEKIYNETRFYVSDPDNSISPHLTWWAVDIVLYTKNNDLVDMWCRVNHLWEESNITTNKITKKQRENRIFLIDSFLKFWFANIASEWWHFSYGDQYWAKFYGKEKALYKNIKY